MAQKVIKIDHSLTFFLDFDDVRPATAIPWPYMTSTMNPSQQIRAIQENISRVIRGKPQVIELIVVALLARGHILPEDIQEIPSGS